MRIELTAVLAAALLASAAPALADAASAFRDGNWAQAAAMGGTEATPASLLLAGRATLSIAAYETRDKARAMQLIDSAEKDFDAALAKAPGSAEAQLQKAIAIGYRAKLTRSPGLGKETRRRMEAVKAAHPDMAFAWAAVAGWHGGAIATLGRFTAGLVLGAHNPDFESGFAQAVKLDPGNPVHRTYFAQQLLDLDAGNAARAAQQLNGIATLATHDGFEALLKRQGIALAAVLKAGDAKAAQALARRQQPFGNLG